MACQNREGDLAEFSANENHAYPPLLSIYGEMQYDQDIWKPC